MTPLLPLAAVMLSGPVGEALPAAPPPARPVILAQQTVTVRQRLTIIRVPLDKLRAAVGLKQRQASQARAMSNWREKKGPKCVALAGMAGAQVSGQTSVDLILRGGTRVRAKLAEACPALDFYGGFYITPTADGRVCADRDAIHARWGGQCEIERFRLLVPARAK